MKAKYWAVIDGKGGPILLGGIPSRPKGQIAVETFQLASHPRAMLVRDRVREATE